LVALWVYGQIVAFDPDSGETATLYYGLKTPTDIKVGPDNRLYVSSWLTNSIIRLPVPR